MKQYYTLFVIRKRDKKVIRRYQAKGINVIDWNKQVEDQVRHTLNTFLDLERKDIDVKSYIGCIEDPSDGYGSEL